MYKTADCEWFVLYKKLFLLNNKIKQFWSSTKLTKKNFRNEPKGLSPYWYTHSRSQFCTTLSDFLLDRPKFHIDLCCIAYASYFYDFLSFLNKDSWWLLWRNDYPQNLAAKFWHVSRSQLLSSFWSENWTAEFGWKYTYW